MNEQEQQATDTRRGFSGLQVTLAVFITILVTAGACYYLYRTYVNPSRFEPVMLSGNEQKKLDAKLAQLGVDPEELLPAARREDQVDAEGRLIPEKYQELEGQRSIRLSERELNAIVASNPELASRFAIDLSEDMASAKLLIPVDPELPVMGGRVLRVNAGVELAYGGDRPIVKLRGVSIMGVPVPNAWLGNLKNVDLVEQFGNGPGFWQSFSAGIQLIEVRDGKLHIELKE